MSTETPADSIPARTVEQARDALHTAAPGLDDATLDAAITDVLDAISPAVTFHRSVVHKAQAAGATMRVSSQMAEASRVSRILGFGRHDHKGFIADNIDLGGGTWVVEIENGPFGDRARFVVIFDSKDTHTFHASLDEALLYAVELRNGGNPDSGGYKFAARALGVRTAFDKED